MPYRHGQPTLLGFVCAPFVDSITRKSLIGGPYTRGIDYMMVKCQLYQLGATIGYAFNDRMNLLIKFLFIPDADGEKVAKHIALCQQDASNNLNRYKDEFGSEPETFYDFSVNWGLGNLIKGKGISLNPGDALSAYVSGNKQIKKSLDVKLDLTGIDDRVMLEFLEGIYFGSVFPELTERMLLNAFNNDKSTMEILGYGLTMAEESRVNSPEQMKQQALQTIQAYIAKYYPELDDPLELKQIGGSGWD